jgi:hypothetical protein
MDILSDGEQGSVRKPPRAVRGGPVRSRSGPVTAPLLAGRRG